MMYRKDWDGEVESREPLKKLLEWSVWEVLCAWGQSAYENEESEWTWEKWLWKNERDGDRLVTSRMEVKYELGKRK